MTIHFVSNFFAICALLLIHLHPNTTLITYIEKTDSIFARHFATYSLLDLYIIGNQPIFLIVLTKRYLKLVGKDTIDWGRNVKTKIPELELF